NPDCAGEVMRTTQEALHHPRFVRNGHLIVIDDPRVGRMEPEGAFVKMSETPPQMAAPAPFAGGHTREGHGDTTARPAVQRTACRPGGPWEGVVIVELASWLAAPFAGAVLADLGARVIKVEPLAGDPMRAMVTNENGIRAMQGKQSLVLDLKTEA